ncbi:MAG: hypothetical protein ACI9XJ_002540 [Marivirga sp.]|jgi:hypothetical protein
MISLNGLRKNSLFALVMLASIFTACKEDEVVPEEENEEEIITDIKLIFTNTADASDVVVASAQDPDGAGVQELEILNEVNLSQEKTYLLTMEVMNNLDTPGEDIAKEIAEEDDEHQIFFSFSNNVFSNPTGNGNIDNGADMVNYNDFDANGNPVGLSTTWTTAASELIGGTFTVRLQHQPALKSATTGANDGDTDFELTFVLNIQ